MLPYNPVFRFYFFFLFHFNCSQPYCVHPRFRMDTATVFFKILVGSLFLCQLHSFICPLDCFSIFSHSLQCSWFNSIFEFVQHLIRNLIRILAGHARSHTHRQRQKQRQKKRGVSLLCQYFLLLIWTYQMFNIPIPSTVTTFLQLLFHFIQQQRIRPTIRDIFIACILVRIFMHPYIYWLDLYVCTVL